MKKLLLSLGIAVAALLALVFAGPAQPPTLAEQVRVSLVKIPYLSVFDNLSYSVDNGVVTLTGEAVQPIIKSYAEQNVKRVPGVTSVQNQIEVLPVSRFDDDIRLRTLSAVRNTSALYRYFLGVNPSIRIVVKNGHVTLDGIVNSQADKQLAFMAANRVPFVFSVTNSLRTTSNL
ncbi:MAG: BON domain-containing protein [Bryobacteraceae bacterium]